MSLNPNSYLKALSSSNEQEPEKRVPAKFHSASLEQRFTLLTEKVELIYEAVYRLIEFHDKKHPDSDTTIQQLQQPEPDIEDTLDNLDTTAKPPGVDKGHSPYI